MSDDEINRAIAEACGWKDLEIEDFSECGVPCFILIGSNNTGTRVAPPNYLNDLNAMHEVEKVIAEMGVNKWWEYVGNLLRHNPTPFGAETAVHATASQRAEAFLHTIGEWKEEAK